jgi:RNA polymerase sigma-70 factor (ECF subfamily)
MTEVEKTLILKLVEGDEQALNALYNKYFKKLTSTAYSVLQNRDEARDVTQERFERLLLNPALFEDIHTNIESWLKRLVWRDALKYQEKNRRREHVNGVYAALPDNSDSIENSPRWQKINEAIEQLPLREQQIFRMRKVEGLRPAEIAEQLGISEKTVKNTTVTASRKVIQIVTSGNVNATFQRESKLWKITLLVLIILGAYPLYKLTHTKKTQSFTNTSPVGSVENNVSIEGSIENNVSIEGPLFYGMPDGSDIILKHGSLVLYSNHFKKERALTLHGEAYFEVVPDPERKFSVHIGDITVTALGTGFSIQANDNEDSITVAVLHGRVLVHIGPSELIQLVSHEKMTFSRKIKSDFPYEPLTWNDTIQQAQIQWLKLSHMYSAIKKDQDPILKFSYVSLDEVIKRVGQHFGVSVRVRDPALRSTKIVAEFREETSLCATLKSLSLVTGCEIYLVQSTPLAFEFKRKRPSLPRTHK